MHKLHNNLVVSLEIASMVALAVILNTITPIRIFWPSGGSVTLVTIPIAVLAFRRGARAGVLGGVITGFILLLLPIAVRVHPLQMILDYPLAFGSLGICGFFSRSVKSLVTCNKKVAIIIASMGLFFATLMRFICHTLSGVIFFGQSTVGQSKYVYSAIYNSTYIVPELVISILILAYIVFYHAYVLHFRRY